MTIESVKDAVSEYTDEVASCFDVNMDDNAIYELIRSHPEFAKAALDGEALQLIPVGLRTEVECTLRNQVQPDIYYITEIITNIYNNAKSAAYVTAYEAAEEKYLSKFEDMKREIEALKSA